MKAYRGVDPLDFLGETGKRIHSTWVDTGDGDDDDEEIMMMRSW